MDSEESRVWEHIHHFVKKSESDSDCHCPFDMIGPIEICKIAEKLPKLYCANLRATCVKMWKALPLPKKMSMNMLLRAGARKGSRAICEYAREKGAMMFISMLEDAAYYGHLDLCLLAIKWQNEICEKFEEKCWTISEFMKKIALSAARGMQSEVLEYALERIETTNAPCFWEELLLNIGLSGNIQWCRKMKTFVDAWVRDHISIMSMTFMRAALQNIEICDFVFEALGTKADSYSFFCCMANLIENGGNLEMFDHWFKISERLTERDFAKKCVSIALRERRIDIVKKLFRLDYSDREIGYLARMGCFDLCREQIAKRGAKKIDWFEIAELAVSYPGDSEFCTLAIDNAIRMAAKRDETIAFLTFCALSSKNAARIFYLTSLHSDHDILCADIINWSYDSRRVFKLILPFLGTIFPYSSIENLISKIDKHQIAWRAAPRVQGQDWHFWQRDLDKMKPVFDYCKKADICPDFCERFSKFLPFLINMEDLTRDSRDIPLI